MEATVNGGSGDGIFAAALNADDGIVAVASTAATQLTITTAIAATTIGRRGHYCRCHCVIVPPSHCSLHQQQLPLTKTIIAMAAIDRRFCQQ
jgi:hypothetical protein